MQIKQKDREIEQSGQIEVEEFDAYSLFLCMQWDPHSQENITKGVYGSSSIMLVYFHEERWKKGVWNYSAKSDIKLHNPIIVRFKRIRSITKQWLIISFNPINSTIQTHWAASISLVLSSFQSYNSTIQTTWKVF
jgi:hypothetical protein